MLTKTVIRQSFYGVEYLTNNVSVPSGGQTMPQFEVRTHRTHALAQGYVGGGVQGPYGSSGHLC